MISEASITAAPAGSSFLGGGEYSFVRSLTVLQTGSILLLLVLIRSHRTTDGEDCQCSGGGEVRSSSSSSLLQIDWKRGKGRREEKSDTDQREKKENDYRFLEQRESAMDAEAVQIAGEWL